MVVEMGGEEGDDGGRSVELVVRRLHLSGNKYGCGTLIAMSPQTPPSFQFSSNRSKWGGGDGGQSGVVLLVTVVKVWSGGAAMERKQVMDVGRSSRCPHQLPPTLTTIVPILFKSFKSFKMGVGEVGGTRDEEDGGASTRGVTYRVHGYGCEDYRGPSLAKVSKRQWAIDI